MRIILPALFAGLLVLSAPVLRADESARAVCEAPEQVITRALMRAQICAAYHGGGQLPKSYDSWFSTTSDALTVEVLLGNGSCGSLTLQYQEPVNEAQVKTTLKNILMRTRSPALAILSLRVPDDVAQVGNIDRQPLKAVFESIHTAPWSPNVNPVPFASPLAEGDANLQGLFDYVWLYVCRAPGDGTGSTSVLKIGAGGGSGAASSALGVENLFGLAEEDDVGEVQEEADASGGAGSVSTGSQKAPSGVSASSAARTRSPGSPGGGPRTPTGDGGGDEYCAVLATGETVCCQAGQPCPGGCQVVDGQLVCPSPGCVIDASGQEICPNDPGCTPVVVNNQVVCMDDQGCFTDPTTGQTICPDADGCYMDEQTQQLICPETPGLNPCPDMESIEIDYVDGQVVTLEPIPDSNNPSQCVYCIATNDPAMFAPTPDGITIGDYSGLELCPYVTVPLPCEGTACMPPIVDYQIPCSTVAQCQEQLKAGILESEWAFYFPPSPVGTYDIFIDKSLQQLKDMPDDQLQVPDNSVFELIDNFATSTGYSFCAGNKVFCDESQLVWDKTLEAVKAHVLDPNKDFVPKEYYLNGISYKPDVGAVTPGSTTYGSTLPYHCYYSGWTSPNCGLLD